MQRAIMTALRTMCVLALCKMVEIHAPSARKRGSWLRTSPRTVAVARKWEKTTNKIIIICGPRREPSKHAGGMQESQERRRRSRSPRCLKSWNSVMLAQTRSLSYVVPGGNLQSTQAACKRAKNAGGAQDHQDAGELEFCDGSPNRIIIMCGPRREPSSMQAACKIAQNAGGAQEHQDAWRAGILRW